jgi:hypothetical protein
MYILITKKKKSLRLKQEGHKSEASLGYIVRPGLKHKENTLSSAKFDAGIQV